MKKTNTVIIGAGQAGLALSRCLFDRGVEHVILERGRVAQRWSERWDSLRLLSPNWMTRLPGWRYEGDQPDGFMARNDVIRFLSGYAASFDAPVEEQTSVTRVSQDDGGWLGETDGGAWLAESVVAATGHSQETRVPRCASELPTDTVQVATGAYRNPDQFPEGGVLVVGASASGVQLADEILRSGREVTIARGDCHGEEPHEDPDYNRHVAKIACQTCHIPRTGGTMAKDFTMWEQGSDKFYEPATIQAEANTTIPAYAWYNLQVANTPHFIGPKGSRQDGKSRIFPFKVYQGKAFYDKKTGQLLSMDFAPPMATGDVVAGLASAAKTLGMKEYEPTPGWQTLYFGSSHLVTRENALTCFSCHTVGGVLNFKDLGYSDEEITRLTQSRGLLQEGHRETEGRLVAESSLQLTRAVGSALCFTA